MLDSFANYILGIDAFDKFRYKLVPEKHLIKRNKKMLDSVEDKDAQMISMTSTVTIYHIP